jgi:hypothetical protein
MAKKRITIKIRIPETGFFITIKLVFIKNPERIELNWPWVKPMVNRYNEKEP